MIRTPNKINRSYSDKYIPGQGEYDLFMNKNVSWMNNAPFVNFFYLLLTAVAFGVIHVSGVVNGEDSWTVLNMLHGLITFVVFHWIKGCPDDSTQGEYNAFTFYEQLDAGVPWTSQKKFLMLVPTVITWISCYAADYKPFYVIVNCVIFFICIIAKMPQMHGVRILGINSTPGIDNPVLAGDNGNKKGK